MFSLHFILIWHKICPTLPCTYLRIFLVIFFCRHLTLTQISGKSLVTDYRAIFFHQLSLFLLLICTYVPFYFSSPYIHHSHTLFLSLFTFYISSICLGCLPACLPPCLFHVKASDVEKLYRTHFLYSDPRVYVCIILVFTFFFCRT